MVAKTLFILFLIHMCGLHYGYTYPLVSGYKLLVRDTCIRLRVSDVNVT